MLSQWIYTHHDDNGATVTSTLNGALVLEGNTSLVHRVSSTGPVAVNSIDVMGWAAGVTSNNVLVRTCFKFLYNLYGVYAIMQDPLTVNNPCYAATIDSSGRVRLWKGTLAQIMFESLNPIKTFFGPVPNGDTWGISLLTQYDPANNAMQLTIESTATAIPLPIVEPAYGFPQTVPRMVVIDPNPLSGGFNAGPFSAQLGTFVNFTNLDDFDVTQIFTG